jgi:hypothetical protein
MNSGTSSVLPMTKQFLGLLYGLFDSNNGMEITIVFIFCPHGSLASFSYCFPCLSLFSFGSSGSFLPLLILNEKNMKRSFHLVSGLHD